jgi:hypothetical protein
MKYLKRCAAVIAIGAFFLMTAAVSPAYADDARMTNLEFAELLVKSIGFEIPAGSEELPDGEYFKVLSGILAANGITGFETVSPEAPFTYRLMVEVLYGIVGTEDMTSYDGMRAYLLKEGFLPALPFGYVVEKPLAVDALNNPAFATLVAEGYRGPLGGDPPDAEAPGFKLEETPPGFFAATGASGV